MHTRANASALTTATSTDKQGSHWWLGCRRPPTQPTKIMVDLHRIAERRGRPIAGVAAARLVTLAYYGLRDGDIGCLPAPSTEAA